MKSPCFWISGAKNVIFMYVLHLRLLFKANQIVQLTLIDTRGGLSCDIDKMGLNIPHNTAPTSDLGVNRAHLPERIEKNLTKTWKQYCRASASLHEETKKTINLTCREPYPQAHCEKNNHSPITYAYVFHYAGPRAYQIEKTRTQGHK